MKYRILTKILLLSLVHFLFFCSSEKSKNSLSFKESIKLRQYMVQGEALYSNHCSNCHQLDGSGLKKLIPPLTSKKFIEEHKETLACIVKNGMTGQLEINGILFNGSMPANSHLTNLQIAEILTYVGNSWDHELGIISLADVEKSLKSCSTTQR